MSLLWLLFRFTKVGLGMRAAALARRRRALVGVRVGWMLALGWGLAAVLGAVAGMMAAPSTFLEPNMMQPVLLYAFAAAVLGGLESPVGAVVGGLVLGVVLNLVGSTSASSTPELRLPVAFAIILARPPRQADGPLRPHAGEARMRRVRVGPLVVGRRRRRRLLPFRSRLPPRFEVARRRSTSSRSSA